MPRRERRRGKRAERRAARGSRLPLRKSLLGRFLAVSALVAACSVAATAWIAVQTTSGAIEQEQGRAIADDARVYDTLLAYGATHAGWEGVQRTVDELAERTGRRVTLTTNEQRRPLADSSDRAVPPALPPHPSAVVNPLAVDTALSGLTSGGPGTDPVTSRTTVTPGPVREGDRGGPVPAPRTPLKEPAPVPSARPGVPPRIDIAGSAEVLPSPQGERTAAELAADRIDPRAVGPFALSAADRGVLRALAERQARCYTDRGFTVTIVTGPSGRPRLETERPSTTADRDVYVTDELDCGTEALATPTASERKALDTLNDLTNACLDRRGHTEVEVALDLTWSSGSRAAKSRADGGDRPVATCLENARLEQLASHVAEPALLFLTAPDGGAESNFDLSPANTAKIAGAAALVLALTVGVSVLAGTRLVRPLHALTGAARRMRDGTDGDRWTPVRVPADSEIGRLAAAFNDMAAHRTRLEEQRKVMVSDVAHELRTPLSTIRGWLEGAQDGVAELDKALVASLLEEAVQLQHIIDDLQDLAEADAGALRLSPEPVRVTELLTQVAAAHRTRADAAGVTLTVRTEADPVTGPGCGPGESVTAPHHEDPWADPVRLRQAVGNLVSNAIRHTPSGGEVCVRAFRRGPDGDLVVEVRDTGEGISAEQLPYVFDRFWRAEKSRNRRTGGSGLGLAIVRRLMEAHGGTVDVSSVVGVGTVFTLWFPMAARWDRATGPDTDGRGVPADG
ncbi:ATP-binding protein [Streptomyces uncialis]|uniref:ATP-binding protein n=1 Tax=Streptomyces uncialis TaxID=1048205 RepID=UPI0038708C2A|nr:ATP-binding protein [Streptomyces uncialis]